ncbi:MAG TPA: hypothetical protein P5013_08680 [Methanoregula sp.]|nr:hypothetical protein [Methanoregula sp.]
MSGLLSLPVIDSPGVLFVYDPQREPGCKAGCEQGTGTASRKRTGERNRKTQEHREVKLSEPARSERG